MVQFTEAYMCHKLANPQFITVRKVQYCHHYRTDTVINCVPAEHFLIPNIRGCGIYAWWRHQVDTFSALLDLCAGNSPVPGIPLTKARDTELWINNPDAGDSVETPSRSLSWIHTFWLHQRAYTRVCATLGNAGGKYCAAQMRWLVNYKYERTRA